MEKEEVLAIKFGKWLEKNVYRHSNMNGETDLLSTLWFTKNREALEIETWYKLFLEHRKKLEEELSLEKV